MLKDQRKKYSMHANEEKNKIAQIKTNNLEEKKTGMFHPFNTYSRKKQVFEKKMSAEKHYFENGGSGENPKINQVLYEMGAVVIIFGIIAAVINFLLG